MARQQPSPPLEAFPDGETNPFLAKMKTSLCKKWSVSRSETLLDIVSLATYLWALNRPEEALAVAEAVAVAVPEPPPLPGGHFNYNIWSQAATAHTLVVKLGRKTRPEQAAVSLQALLADPGISRENLEYLADQVTQARDELAAPVKARVAKWRLACLSSAIDTMVLFAELGTAGDPVFVPYVEDATVLIPQLLERLGAELQRT
jgi:hypothetical protein